MDLPEKIETALVNYLQSLTWPVYFDPAQILAGESENAITTQTILCICEDGSEEDPPNTGNFWFPVRVELRTPSAQPTDEELATSGFLTNLEKHRGLTTIMETGLMIDDLQDRLGPLADEFNCFGILDRSPIRAQSESYWMTGRSFRTYACSAALA